MDPGIAGALEPIPEEELPPMHAAGVKPRAGWRAELESGTVWTVWEWGPGLSRLNLELPGQPRIHAVQILRRAAPDELARYPTLEEVIEILATVQAEGVRVAWSAAPLIVFGAVPRAELAYGAELGIDFTGAPVRLADGAPREARA